MRTLNNLSFLAISRGLPRPLFLVGVAILSAGTMIMLSSFVEHIR